MQLCKKPEKKIQDFNGIWTRDLSILVWFSKQTHNWPAPNISDFIAQLVRALHWYHKVTGSNPVEVLNFFFQASYTIALIAFTTVFEK